MNRWFALLALLPSLVTLRADEVPLLAVKETDEAILVTKGKTLVLTYNKAEVPPPAGVDPVFKRSGFIHPVRTPSGRVVRNKALLPPSSISASAFLSVAP